MEGSGTENLDAAKLLEPSPTMNPIPEGFLPTLLLVINPMHKQAIVSINCTDRTTAHMKPSQLEPGHTGNSLSFNADTNRRHTSLDQSANAIALMSIISIGWHHASDSTLTRRDSNSPHEEQHGKKSTTCHTKTVSAHKCLTPLTPKTAVRDIEALC